MEKPLPIVKHVLTIMKITLVQIVISAALSGMALASTEDAYGQGILDKILTVSAENKKLRNILSEIEKTAGVKFSFNPKTIPLNQRVTAVFRGSRLKEVLDHLFDPLQIRYDVSGDYVILSTVLKTGGQPADDPLETMQFYGMNVSGTVTDENSQPLPGANVIEKGTTNGTTTDVEGKFSMSVKDENSVLVFSFIGYTSQEIAVNGRSVIEVILVPDVQSLEEVVVVGYGTQKKENLTGAISNITAKDIQTTTHSSLAQSLQGKIAGLQIRQNTGQPGDFNTMINIRGFGAPLYVIDGVARGNGNQFQRLNPEDIESISILKDASAAIYGLNAANGVIIVTTKKGTSGKPQFQYSAVVGGQSPTDVPVMANAAQWMEMRNDADVNIGKSPYLPLEELQKYQQGIPGYESTNWYDETMKKWAMQQQHNISAQGGSDDVTYFMGIGFLKEDGLVKTNDINYKKYNFRSNLSVNLTKNLLADLKIAARYDKRTVPGQSFLSIFRGTVSSLPTNTPYANGNTAYPALVTDGQSLNPVALSNRELTGYNEDVNKFFQSSIALTYEFPFIRGLKLKGLAAFDSNNSLGKGLAKSFKLYSYDAPADAYTATELRKPSRINNSYDDNNNTTLQAYLIYNNTIAHDHDLGATLVYEQRQGWGRNSFLQREYEFYTIDQINMAGQNNQRTGGIESQYASMSYLGRITYDYKSKYMLEIASRYDGSYRYHPNKRWGLFPVVSGGWRISEENFFKNHLPVISDLKVRGSYGIVGQDAGNPFQYVPGFSTSGGGGYEFVNGNYTAGVASPAIVDEDLTWFESNIKDIGMELGLFKGKLNFEFDVYQRDRTGLLAIRNVSLPNTFGATLPQENLNSDRVRGIEFAVGYNHKIGDLRYSIRGNFNFARTMNVYVERAPFTSSWDRWRSGSANRWDDIGWMFDLEGQFQSAEEITFAPLQNGGLGNTRELPGDFRYRDVNGDGVIDGDDTLPLAWGGNPKANYGLMLNASWKGFDFNALLQGSGKYSVRFTHAYATLFWSEGNHPAYFYDRWHKADPYDPASEWVPGKWPASRLQQDIGSMYKESQAWRKDASYVRLKSLELGYTFTPKLIKNLGLSSVRVYVNAHNIFTITDPYVRPFDPEKIAGPLNTGWVYPLAKSYNMGVNVRF